MLKGRTIAIAEHRFEGELSQLIQRKGGTVLSCPLLEECLVENLPDLSAFIEQVIQPGFDFLVFFTGVGFRFLHERSVAIGRGDEFLSALERARVVARGPKPQAAMRRLRVRVDLVPSEATSEGLIELLASEDLCGRRIGVQLYGTPNARFCDSLEALGASVDTVQVYEYRPVSSSEQVERFIAQLVGSEADAVAFTSAPQVRSLFEHADRLGATRELVRALTGGVVVVAVGKVTCRALEERGLSARIMPAIPKMGPMVEAMDTWFSRGS